MSCYDRITYCDVVECCETCPRYGDDCDGDFDEDEGGEQMKICENCKNWIQMKELEGKCVLYGLKHCEWTPSEATCDEWESDESEDEEDEG